MAKYSLSYSGKFKRDFKRYRNKTKELTAIMEVIDLLSTKGFAGLPERMRAHKLLGNYNGYWECHIFPDLLIIWLQEEEPTNNIYLVRIGSHADLF